MATNRYWKFFYLLLMMGGIFIVHPSFAQVEKDKSNPRYRQYPVKTVKPEDKEALAEKNKDKESKEKDPKEKDVKGVSQENPENAKDKSKNDKDQSDKDKADKDSDEGSVPVEADSGDGKGQGKNEKEKDAKDKEKDSKDKNPKDKNAKDKNGKDKNSDNEDEGDEGDGSDDGSSKGSKDPSHKNKNSKDKEKDSKDKNPKDPKEKKTAGVSQKGEGDPNETDGENPRIKKSFVGGSEKPCEDDALKELHAIVTSDENNVLGKMYEITVMKVAREVLSQGNVTLEGYTRDHIEALEEKLEKISDSKLVQKRVLSAYESFGKSADLKEVDSDLAAFFAKGKTACHWNKTTHLKNKDAAAYILAASVADKDSGLTELDAATVWAVETIRKNAGPSFKDGANHGNLLQLSHRVARYLGAVEGANPKTTAQLDRAIEKLQKEISDISLAAYKQVKSNFSACLAELHKDCPSCQSNAKMRFMNDHLGFKQLTQGLADAVIRQNQAKAEKDLKGKVGDLSFDFSSTLPPGSFRKDESRVKGSDNCEESEVATHKESEDDHSDEEDDGDEAEENSSASRASGSQPIEEEDEGAGATVSRKNKSAGRRGGSGSDRVASQDDESNEQSASGRSTRTPKKSMKTASSSMGEPATSAKRKAVKKSAFVPTTVSPSTSGTGAYPGADLRAATGVVSMPQAGPASSAPAQKNAASAESTVPKKQPLVYGEKPSQAMLDEIARREGKRVKPAIVSAPAKKKYTEEYVPVVKQYYPWFWTKEQIQEADELHEKQRREKAAILTANRYRVLHKSVMQSETTNWPAIRAKMKADYFVYEELPRLQKPQIGNQYRAPASGQ